MARGELARLLQLFTGGLGRAGPVRVPAEHLPGGELLGAQLLHALALLKRIDVLLRGLVSQGLLLVLELSRLLRSLLGFLLLPLPPPPPPPPDSADAWLC